MFPNIWITSTLTCRLSLCSWASANFQMVAMKTNQEFYLYVTVEVSALQHQWVIHFEIVLKIKAIRKALKLCRFLYLVREQYAAVQLNFCPTIRADGKPPAFMYNLFKRWHWHILTNHVVIWIRSRQPIKIRYIIFK